MSKRKNILPTAVPVPALETQSLSAMSTILVIENSPFLLTVLVNMNLLLEIRVNEDWLYPKQHAKKRF